MARVANAARNVRRELKDMTKEKASKGGRYDNENELQFEKLNEGKETAAQRKKRLLKRLNAGSQEIEVEEELTKTQALYNELSNPKLALILTGVKANLLPSKDDEE